MSDFEFWLMGLRRWADWLRQSRAALRQAEDSLKDGHYWASCFFSHQAAEFAAKALLVHRGVEARGHSVAEILKKAVELGIESLQKLERDALNLDRHYLQSRNVNTFHAGAPIDYYTSEEAEKSLEAARKIVGAVEEKIGSLS